MMMDIRIAIEDILREAAGYDERSADNLVRLFEVAMETAKTGQRELDDRMYRTAIKSYDRNTFQTDAGSALRYVDIYVEAWREADEREKENANVDHDELRDHVSGDPA